MLSRLDTGWGSPKDHPVKAPTSTHAGLSTGMVRSPHIQAFLLGSVMTFNSLRPSSWTAPMGNGTAERHNVGTTLDLGHF